MPLLFTTSESPLRVWGLALDLLGVRRLTEMLNSTGSTRLTLPSQGPDVLPSLRDPVGGVV